jgi:hypothetical protein
MVGDHHGWSTGRATLLVRAVDGILGTHNTGQRTNIRTCNFVNSGPILIRLTMMLPRSQALYLR